MSRLSTDDTHVKIELEFSLKNSKFYHYNFIDQLKQAADFSLLNLNVRVPLSKKREADTSHSTLLIVQQVSSTCGNLPTSNISQAEKLPTPPWLDHHGLQRRI